MKTTTNLLAILYLISWTACASQQESAALGESTKSEQTPALNTIVPIAVTSRDEGNAQNTLYCWYGIHSRKPSDFQTQDEWVEEADQSFRSAYVTLTHYGAVTMQEMEEHAKQAAQTYKNQSISKVLSGAVLAVLGGLLSGLTRGLSRVAGYGLGAGGIVMGGTGASDSIDVALVRDFAEKAREDIPVLHLDILSFGTMREVISSAPVPSFNVPERSPGFCASYARRYILSGGSELN